MDQNMEFFQKYLDTTQITKKGKKSIETYKHFRSEILTLRIK
jgi:hypothetical protein